MADDRRFGFDVLDAQCAAGDKVGSSGMAGVGSVERARELLIGTTS